jgi:hypothetical protein
MLTVENLSRVCAVEVKPTIKQIFSCENHVSLRKSQVSEILT